MTSPPPITLDLVADGAVRLALDHAVYPLAERWIPRGLGEPRGTPAEATLSVHSGRTPLARPTRRATLALGSAAAWVEDGARSVLVRGATPSSGGVLRRAGGQGWLQVDPKCGEGAAADLYSMLTVSTALLLAGLGRALVHAAAVVAPPPDGGAWLLVGDARSGKSTTCATLASAGWGFLSDDQVVLEAREDGVHAEGWLRPFHLDATDEGGEPSGLRREISPAELGLEGWRRSAPLAGVILPAVSPRESTLLTPVAAPDALAGLVRQSPWLLACPDTAATTLAVLRHAAEAGAFALRLGLDTYQQPVRLADLLASTSSRRAALESSP